MVFARDRGSLVVAAVAAVTVWAAEPTAAAAATPEELVRATLAPRARAFGASPEAIAAASARTTAVGTLKVVHLQQRIDGLPVIGASLTSTIDARSGEVTGTTGRFVSTPVAPAFTLDAPSAITAVVRRTGARTRFPASAKAAFLARGSDLEPIWIVRAGWGRRAVTFMVSARDGRLLAVRRAVRDLDRARVWRQNPGADRSTPLEEVTLAGRDQTASTLSGPGLAAFGCQEANDPSYGPYCATIQRAAADASGDFLYDPVIASADPLDPFSEVHAFYHVKRVLDFFTGTMGVALPDGFRVAVMANYREALPADETDPSSELVLGNLDNAFALDSDNEYMFGPGFSAGLALGQGLEVDYAYDGEVIAHEMGHVVVDFNLTTGEEVWEMPHDAQGIDPLWDGALGEGFADYVAGIAGGGACLGEYVTSGCEDRNMEIPRSCPLDLTGESHEDGRIFNSATWKIRGQLSTAGHDAVAIDRAILEGRALAGHAANGRSAAESIAARLTAAFGSDAGDAARAVFREQGLLECERVKPIESRDSLAVSDDPLALAIALPGLMGMEQTPRPPPFQWSLTVGAEETTPLYLILAGSCMTFTGDFTPDTSPPNLELAVSPGSPVEFTYEQGPATTAARVPLGWDAEAGVYWFRLRGYEPVPELGELSPGTYHLALLDDEAMSFGCFFSDAFVYRGPLAGDTPPGDPDPMNPEEDGSKDEGGCGCVVGRREPRPPMALMMLVLVALGAVVGTRWVRARWASGSVRACVLPSWRQHGGRPAPWCGRPSLRSATDPRGPGAGRSSSPGG